MPAITSLRSSFKFVSAETLPQIESTTTFQEAYSQLSRRKFGGFILSEKGVPRSYVKGLELAEKIIAQASGNHQRLRIYCSQPIGLLIAELAANEALVPVVDAQTSNESELQDRADTVFRVVDGSGFVGWYLNHEGVLETATRKTVFICQQGHRNADPDHGTCYSCPFPIVRTETE
jgi:hypothetical protein